ncbi:MAG: Rpn family recombination-promoting nuclease/putative transposase [Anaerolineales bacterium]|nr:Rpn family recombination-promoting nuclease/putative transposase [Anaerolineales bacterium]
MAVSKNPHDSFFKAVFARPELTGEFLQQFLPPAVIAELDLSTLALRKDSFIDEEFRQQFADLLYAVQLTDQSQAFVYVLFEHKSYPQPLMALHMLRYMVRIWEQGLRESRTALPTPILPIVIYHGADAWREPFAMAELFRGPETMRPYWPTFIYQLNNLTAPDQPALDGTLYLRVALLVLRAILKPDFLAQLPLLVKWLAQLTREYLAVEYVNTVLRYITSVRKDVTVPALRQALQAAAVEDKETLMTSWVEELIQQGELQGEQKGMTVEARRLVTRQLQHQIGPLPASISRHLDRLSLDQLEALSTFLLDARSLAEVETYLKQQR